MPRFLEHRRPTLQNHLLQCGMLFLCRHPSYPFHAVKKWLCMFRRGRVDVLVCSLVGADRPPKQAMPVAIACLEQKDLCFRVFCWERKVIRAEKIADGRVLLPARSGYISENRGTILGKSRRGRVHPAVFRTRQGKSGRRPISCVRFTLK